MKQIRRISQKILAGCAITALMAGMTCSLTACGGSEDYMEAWMLNDGGTGASVASSVKGGTAGIQQWGAVSYTHLTLPTNREV